MSERLDCTNAEERLSELHDDALDPAARAEVERHLATCARCRELFEALGEVVSALRSAPEMEPARDLAERAASAALAAAAAERRRSSLRLVLPRLGSAARQVIVASVPREVRWMAAALAIALTAAVLLAQSFVGTPVRAANRVVQRTVTAGAYIAERKDRFVEDLRILRVVIRTAFEGRLDRVNDRVDDYRRLLERRRGVVPGGSAPDAKTPAAEDGTRPTSQFVNFGLARAVAEGVTREAAGPASGPSTMRSRARRS
jgi:putative zinc finger protein